MDHASRRSDREAAVWWHWCVCRWGAAIVPTGASCFRLWYRGVGCAWCSLPRHSPPGRGARCADGRRGR
eukprot:10264779-Alexandrium_andersonii.AAC.1